MSNRTRVFVIGLDGGTWDIIQPLVEKGRLPNFEYMIKNGCSGVLKSTLPPVTPPAWVSIVTGKNPGKHGVFDFYSFTDGELKVISTKSIGAKRIWETLSEFGHKVLVVNVPVFYPPDKVNGIFISGMLSPSKDSNFVYPGELKNYLLENKYEIETDPEEGVSRVRSHIFSGKKGAEKILEKYNEVEQNRALVTYKFIEDIDPDFVFIVFEGTDRLQHYLWSEESIQYIYKHYEWLDNILGDFLNYYNDGNTTFFIISDHGFYKIEKVFLINSFLSDIGLLKTKNSGVNPFEFYIQKMLKVNLINVIFKNISRYILPLLPILKNASVIDNIDFTKSKAYCITHSSMGIFVPECSDKKKLIDEICTKLNNLIDTGTNSKFIKAYPKEEIYKGSFLERSYDIIMELEKGYSLITSIIKPNEKLRNNNFIQKFSEAPIIKNGDHTTEGIFIASGASIKKNLSLDSTVLDIAPTIKYLFGLPIEDDADGRVLKEIIDYEPPRKDLSSSGAKEKIANKIRSLQKMRKI